MPAPFPVPADPAFPAAFPWVAVHGAAEVGRALDAARRAARPGVTLLSAPGAAGFAGPAWWAALMTHAADIAAGIAPGIMMRGVLDCGGSAPDALAALRLGLPVLVLRPVEPDRFRAVSARAEALGATILPDRPPALDAADPALEQRLRDVPDPVRVDGIVAVRVDGIVALRHAAPVASGRAAGAREPEPKP